MQRTMNVKTIWLDKVDSTQSYVKEHRKEFDPKGITCVAAKQQTKGRGRFNRVWHSPKDCNLYATFYFQLPSDMLHLVSLGQIMALSLTKFLISENFCPKIKWPNDVLLSGKKVAGILCETEIQNSDADIFLGIGLNINMPQEQLDQIDQPATSLMVETNREWNKEKLLEDLTKQFLKDFDIFIKEGFTPFHCQFENLMAYKGESICCFDGKKEWKGICHSLTNDGQLNLYLPNGDIQTISSGNIKLHKN
jgi:BirA family transcriptional regulator, biotin operon repressor / biotin---[acetyl-CoA-carboxylase] ligase